MTVKTVKSRTGGVHKRFTTSGSSSSDSDEAEEAEKKGVKTFASSHYSCGHDELHPTELAQYSSWDTGKSVGVQQLQCKEGSQTSTAMSSRIVGGRKDKFRAVSTVIHVPAGTSLYQYDVLPDLCGLPRVGDKIVFKVGSGSPCPLVARPCCCVIADHICTCL